MVSLGPRPPTLEMGFQGFVEPPQSLYLQKELSRISQSKGSGDD